ncbi:MAG: DUF2147 domain-containing protein [Rhizobacter sp.]|nr:DUF2147 domain-containing protein [Rhizobacter sp.]
MKKMLLALGAMFVLSTAAAQSSPVGVWKTIDDSTKKETSQVRIVDAGGVFSGRIEKLLAPDAKQDAVCDECTDDRKGKPIVGMNIIRGIKKNAETEGLWDGGTILDPGNGKTYKLRLKPSEDGKKLEVRGYIGAPMFGRSQTWHRAE